MATRGRKIFPTQGRGMTTRAEKCVRHRHRGTVRRPAVQHGLQPYGATAVPAGTHGPVTAVRGCNTDLVSQRMPKGRLPAARDGAPGPPPGPSRSPVCDARERTGPSRPHRRWASLQPLPGLVRVVVVGHRVHGAVRGALRRSPPGVALLKGSGSEGEYGAAQRRTRGVERPFGAGTGRAERASCPAHAATFPPAVATGRCTPHNHPPKDSERWKPSSPRHGTAGADSA